MSARHPNRATRCPRTRLPAATISTSGAAGAPPFRAPARNTAARDGADTSPLPCAAGAPPRPTGRDAANAAARTHDVAAIPPAAASISAHSASENRIERARLAVVSMPTNVTRRHVVPPAGAA
jgi:hypothetical protein